MEKKNIIKLGLPKWDLFYNYSLTQNYKLREKCIFIMFTWRKLRKGKKISPDYFNNILQILNNSRLKKILKIKNITLYISLHHNLINNQRLFKTKLNAKYINQIDIFNCLMKCNLVISDFSSIIFDLIYRKMPFIIFIPDSNDKNLEEIYDSKYFDIINGLKNNSLQFENKFFNVKDTIKKIEYYIKNDFKLDDKLRKLYKKFNFNYKNSIKSLIEYLRL